jgi:hypothetical protein
LSNGFATCEDPDALQDICARRIEHTHTYVLTPEGQRVAVFYTKINNRLLRPLLAADQPQAPPGLRQALATIDHHVTDYIAQARPGTGGAAQSLTRMFRIPTPTLAGSSAKRARSVVTSGAPRGVTA